MRYFFSASMTKYQVFMAWLLGVNWGAGQIGSAWELLAWIVAAIVLNACGTFYLLYIDNKV